MNKGEWKREEICKTTRENATLRETKGLKFKQNPRSSPSKSLASILNEHARQNELSDRSEKKEFVRRVVVIMHARRVVQLVEGERGRKRFQKIPRNSAGNSEKSTAWQREEGAYEVARVSNDRKIFERKLRRDRQREKQKLFLLATVGDTLPVMFLGRVQRPHCSF